MVVVPNDPPITSQKMLTRLEIYIELVQKIFGNSTKNMSHPLCLVISLGRYLIYLVFRNLKKFLSVFLYLEDVFSVNIVITC